MAPVHETLNAYIQLFRERLRSASILNFFIESVHGNKSKRYV